MNPLATSVRLALAAGGTAVWLITRRNWFVGTRLLGGLLAFALIELAAWDVILWWPR